MTGYAIIKSGSKQYMVKPGDVIDVELVDANDGKIEFTDILLLNDGKSSKIGAPAVAKAIVRGEVEGIVRSPKVIAFKYKKRKSYQRKVGHRQNYTRVKITEIAS